MVSQIILAACEKYLYDKDHVMSKKRITELHISPNTGRLSASARTSPACQEQIELSGFVAHELSAFSVLE